MLHNLISIESGLKVLLVSEDEDRHVCEEFFPHERLELIRALFKTHVISGVDDVNHTVSVLVVVLPVGADLTLTSDIPDVQFKSILSLNTRGHQREVKKIISTKAQSIKFTYKRLDVESLGGHDVGGILVTHGLKDGGLSRVVKTKHQNTSFVLVFLQTAKQLKESHLF
jgi:hypothetical protein